LSCVRLDHKGNRMEKIIFTKYSNERARAFCIRTDICQSEDGSRIVRKSACYPEGRAHVERMRFWYERLEELYRRSGISMNRPVSDRKQDRGAYGSVEFEYVTGQTLEEQLDKMLGSGDVDAAIARLLDFVDVVRRAGTREAFGVTEEFRKVFGDADLPDGLFCAPVTDLDMIAANAFVTGDGWMMMDYEWSFDFPIPVNYVIFRILHFYIYGSTARTVLYTKNLYGRAGLDGEEVRQYERMEEHFQQYVLGGHLPLRFLYPEMTPGCIDFRDEKKQQSIAELGREARSQKQEAAGLQLCVDSIERTEDELEIRGWSFNEKLICPQFSVTDAAGGKRELKRLEFFMRRDVNALFGMEDSPYTAGFDLIIHLPEKAAKRWGERYVLCVQAGEQQATYVVDVSRLAFKNGKIGQKLVKLKSKEQAGGPKYFSPYEMGLFGESRKLRKEDQRFGGWRLAMQLTETERKAQREHRFDKNPLISIVIPLYQTPPQYLRAMLDSILSQTYGNFEICLADGSGEDDSVGAQVRKEYGTEARIQYKKLKQNGGISENTNEALAMAHGEYVMLGDHDDLLEDHALYEIVKVINEHSDADVIYTDEDKVDAQGQHYFEPHFKPDFNLYMLRTSNYICHIFVVKRHIAEDVGGFRREYDGAQDYDFILRCCERAEGIYHIPKILYHWRTHEASTASNPESKLYAWEAGRRALAEHYHRIGVDADVTLAELFGRYRTRWKIQGMPLVSILIPNKDHSEDLTTCVRSLCQKSSYQNYEILIVENNSEEPKTFACYKKLQEEFPCVRVITWENAFHYSKINNFAAQEADGEYLLLLNNDTEVIEPHWIEEMLGICQQKEVGAVGAKLFYPDGTIQHAGVILGLGGVAGHVFAGMDGNQCGYVARANTTQNLSAVTAACMMTKRSVFEEVGGLDEKLTVALNDVDYCMKVVQTGRLVVYTPYAQLYHNESVTRGLEDSPEKRERFAQEQRLFEQKWGEQIKEGDPYYNINLSRVSGQCSFRIPR